MHEREEATHRRGEFTHQTEQDTFHLKSMSPFPVPSEYTAASALLLLDRSNNVEDPMKLMPSAISRKAEAILNLLSSAVVGDLGCLPEVQIRQKIGDSPDTSKALRQLVELNVVKKSGTGGRDHPYVYTIA